jgi:hypothetical protein
MRERDLPQRERREKKYPRKRGERRKFTRKSVKMYGY